LSVAFAVPITQIAPSGATQAAGESMLSSGVIAVWNTSVMTGTSCTAAPVGAVVAALPAASSATCGSRLQPVSARTHDIPRARIWMATIFIFRFSPVIAS